MSDNHHEHHHGEHCSHSHVAVNRGHVCNHAHGHSGHHHSHSCATHSSGSTGRIGLALGITLVFMLAEIIGGLMSGSLSLLSDAAHMFTDSGALGLSLVAGIIAMRKGTANKTFGYRRVEVIAALINGLALWCIAGIILHEAYDRFKNPQEIKTGIMLVVAIFGLLANAACAFVLHGGHQHNINMRGAFLHVMADMLGSVGVIIAGVIIWMTGWTLADPLISVGIAFLIFYSSWSLVMTSLHILMEGAPEHISRTELLESLRAVDGVTGVHELHVWTLTSGFDSLSVHLLVADMGKAQDILSSVKTVLSERFGITHSTIQIETESKACEGENCCG